MRYSTCYSTRINRIIVVKDPDTDELPSEYWSAGNCHFCKVEAEDEAEAKQKAMQVFKYNGVDVR